MDPIGETWDVTSECNKPPVVWDRRPSIPTPRRNGFHPRLLSRIVNVPDGHLPVVHSEGECHDGDGNTFHLSYPLRSSLHGDVANPEIFDVICDVG